MAELDFREDLYKLAEKAQDQNADRLSRGVSVHGGSLAPDAEPGKAPGVKSGAMLADATNRANISVTATSFKITPSPEIAPRWNAFCSGTDTQPPRPFSGISSELMKEAASTLAKSARDKIVRRMNARPK